MRVLIIMGTTVAGGLMGGVAGLVVTFSCGDVERGENEPGWAIAGLVVGVLAGVLVGVRLT